MRKGQVTMFVIMGLVLVLLLGIVFMFFNSRPTELVTDPVPNEFRPVSSFVEGCIQSVTLDAVSLMGAHGGYISPLNTTLTPNFLRYDADPSRSDLVSLTESMDNLVPYYIHVPGAASSRNYNLESAAPTIDNMQHQIARYLESNMRECTAGFTQFEDAGVDVSESSNLSVQVFIRNTSIDVQMVYGLDLKRDGVEAQVSRFATQVNFPLKKYYDLAMGLVDAELTTQFAESFTISLLNYYSGPDSNKLPPMISINNKPYVVTWSATKAENDLNGLLVSYVSALQVKAQGAATTDVEEAFYRSLQLELFDTPIDANITFIYKDETLIASVQPSQGELIRPQVELKKGSDLIPEEKTNTYRFFYDVSYPIFVEIRGNEPESPIPEYSFIVAIESNIIENKPVMAWQLGFGSAQWDYANLNVTYTVPEGVTFDSAGNNVEFGLRGNTKSLFCVEGTWNSGNISLQVTDSQGQPLDASVSFGCGDYDECYAGTSASGRWSSQLPICAGGYLTIASDGYGSKTLQLSTEQGVSQSLGVQVLEKLKEVKVTASKLPISKQFTRDNDWEWSEGMASIGSEQPIDAATQQLVVSITQTGFTGAPLSRTIIFGKEGVDTETITLAPGQYDISAMLVDYSGITIPANCTRECEDRGLMGLGCSEHVYFPESDIVLDSAVWGGAEITSDITGSFEITDADLENYDELYIRAFELPDLSQSSPPGACILALDEMGKIEEYSRIYKQAIWPSWG